MGLGETDKREEMSEVGGESRRNSVIGSRQAEEGCVLKVHGKGWEWRAAGSLGWFQMRGVKDSADGVECGRHNGRSKTTPVSEDGVKSDAR